MMLLVSLRLSGREKIYTLATIRARVADPDHFFYPDLVIFQVGSGVFFCRFGSAAQGVSIKVPMKRLIYIFPNFRTIILLSIHSQRWESCCYSVSQKTKAPLYAPVRHGNTLNLLWLLFLKLAKKHEI